MGGESFEPVTPVRSGFISHPNALYSFLFVNITFKQPIIYLVDTRLLYYFVSIKSLLSTILLPDLLLVLHVHYLTTYVSYLFLTCVLERYRRRNTTHLIS